MEPFGLPSVATVLAARRMVDQWLEDREAELKALYPEQSAQLDAILNKLKTSEAMVATLALLSTELQLLATGSGPVTPDDVDLA